MLPKPTGYALRWIPPPPPPPEGVLQVRLAEPPPAPRPRRVPASVPDFNVLAGLDGEPRLYATIRFSTLGELQVGIGSDGTLATDPGQRELAVAAVERLVALLAPPAPPPPRPWWRRWSRA